MHKFDVYTKLNYLCVHASGIRKTNSHNKIISWCRKWKKHIKHKLISSIISIRKKLYVGLYYKIALRQKLYSKYQIKSGKYQIKRNCRIELVCQESDNYVKTPWFLPQFQAWSKFFSENEPKKWLSSRRRERVTFHKKIKGDNGWCSLSFWGTTVFSLNFLG